MEEVPSRPGPGGSEKVRLLDGICGARDLVYFPPWIPVLPAGFSQVLASISLGSCEERVEGGREGRQRWSLSHTTQHRWGDGKRGVEHAEIKNKK